MGVTGVLITAAVVAAAASTYQQIDAYRQEKANAKTNESIANANAKAAENEAKAAEFQASENARRQLIEKRRTLSAMRAQYGASGAALSSGSPLAQMAQASSDLTLKANDTLVAGMTQSTSLLSQANVYRAQGQLARQSVTSKGALIGGITSTWANGAVQAAMAKGMSSSSSSSSSTGYDTVMNNTMSRSSARSGVPAPSR